MTTLQTARLILRPVQKADVPVLTTMYADPVVTQMYAYCVPIPEKDVVDRVDRWVARWEKNELSFFSVVEKKSSDVIGVVGGGVDTDKTCEFAYVFRKEYWGEGYGREAVQEFVKYLRKLPGIDCIKATVLPRNIASVKILEGLGMKHMKTENAYGYERFIYTFDRTQL